MERDKLKELIKWKNNPNRKPLILKGARHVGKTWLLKEFGNTQYQQMVYLDFERSPHLKTIFTDDFDIKRLIIALQAESGLTINPGTTLLIFDEIQAIPEALTYLQYFQEDAPGFHIVSATSLLGMAKQSNISIPTGKVDFINLYPMSFEEYLKAIDEEGLQEILSTGYWKLITAYKSKYIDYLRHYYYVGGMPEAVSKYCENKNFNEVRNIHKQILNSYDQDFSLYAHHQIVPRIRMIWNSIPAQLARKNRKFVYGSLKRGARAKDFEKPLTWLNECGQIHKVNKVSNPALPLISGKETGAFKLYMVDVGLLSAMGDIDAKTLLSGNKIYSDVMIAITEQYVLQQLMSSGNKTVNYWSAERSMAEVDFIVQNGDETIPVEVKDEENLHAKSLRSYHEKFAPRVCIRTSMSDYRRQDWMINLPLYAISQFKNI